MTRQQALTAAEIAFGRAKERDVIRDSVLAADTGNGPPLGRKQSVRFTGPNAVPIRTRSITRRGMNAYLDDLHSQSARNEISVPQQGEEFVETNIASEPSSYRRLRKAKSMFNPAKTSSVVFTAGTPNSKRHFQRHSMQSSDGYSESFGVPDPRLRRSMSFLRGVTERLPANNRSYGTQDAAVQLARDQYLCQIEEQRLKEHPSFFNLGRRRPSQKAFRKTVRTSSTNNKGGVLASQMPSSEPVRNKGVVLKARIISQTLKRTIKKVFLRSSDEDETMPAQQLDAIRPHYGVHAAAPDTVEHQYPSIPSPDVELLRRVGSRESVLRDPPDFAHKGYSARSFRSVSSEEDVNNVHPDQSRVTSWTDSTPANTINMSQLKERKRLSIIKEDGGPHQSSASHRPYGELNDGYAAFTQPIRQSSICRATGLPDTRRLYSALQKRNDENSQLSVYDDNQSSTDSDFDHARSHRSTSTLRRALSPSIRMVEEISEERLVQPPGMQVSKSAIFNPVIAHIADYRLWQSKGQADEGPQLTFFDSKDDLTPQQIAGLNESDDLKSNRPLRDVGASFCPPSPHVNRTNTSPFQRAMHASSNEEENGVTFAELPRRTGSQYSVLRNESVPRSDSVYSRTSGGHTPKLLGSSVSLSRSDSHCEPGIPSIKTNGDQRCMRVPGSFGQQSHASHSPSGEWKNFIAPQVAHLDNYGAENGQTYDALLVRESGHIRENAQLDGEDVTIGRLQKRSDSLKQPLGIIQGNANRRTTLKHKASSPIGENFPVLERRPSLRASVARNNENSPMNDSMSQTWESSKARTDKVSPRRVANPSVPIRKQASQASLTSRKEQAAAFMHTNNRHSPERAERLRRLQSKSSLSLRKIGDLQHTTVLFGDQNQNLKKLNASPSSPWRSGGATNQPETTLTARRTTPAGHQKLLDNFLKGRPREMKISEESAGDPAFL